MTLINKLKKIDPNLLQLQQTPQMGLPGPFPMQALEKALQDMMGKESVKVAFTEKGWIQPKELFEGLGKNLFYVPVCLSPLKHPIYIAASEQDLKELMAEVLCDEGSLATFFEQPMVESFYQYLVLELLQVLDTAGFAKPLSLRLQDLPKSFSEELSKKPHWVGDAQISLSGKNLWARLFISEEFRAEWKQHLVGQPSYLSINYELPLNLCIQVAESLCSIEDLKQARIQDVILLDRCAINVQNKRGSLTLTIAGSPIFRGKIKDTGIELIEFPFEELGNTADLPEDEAFLEKEQEMDESLQKNLAQIPMNLTVELATLPFTIKELSELSSGSVLPFEDRDPTTNLTLKLNGKKIGTGELVQAGEAVGVRITQI